MVPILQLALNAAYRERYQAWCPFKVVFEREPKTTFMTLLESSEEEGTAERLDLTRV